MHHVVFVTVPSVEIARKLAGGILEKRLAACANIVSGLESHYWWEGEMCQENEVLMILKTTASRLPELEVFVLKEHPYDTPEFVSWSIDSGSKKYLDWLSLNTSLSE